MAWNRFPVSRTPPASGEHALPTVVAITDYLVELITTQADQPSVAVGNGEAKTIAVV